MTENEIKEMLNGIINNDEKWECRKEIGYDQIDELYIYSEWKPYKLGDEIRSDYEYRKVEKYIVFFNMNINLEIGLKSKHSNLKSFEFEGTKEECEQWVKDHSKTWLEEYIKNETLVMNSERDIAKKSIQAVCKKILEEFENKLPLYIDTGRNYLLKDIKSIIKDLGVEV